MNILHLIPYIGQQQGGPVESLRLLADAQALQGHRVRVVHTGKPADGTSVTFSEAVETIALPAVGPTRWSPGTVRRIRRHGFSPQIIHSHGLWLDLARQANGASRVHSIPHIISPCGMLQSAALKVSRLKKRIAWILFQKRSLDSARAIHAKSLSEKNHIVSLFPKAFIPVIPNPITPPPQSSHAAPSGATGHLQKADLFGSTIRPESKIVLFLGRIHPVKGLHRLILAWASVVGAFPDWRLVLVGPDEAGHQRHLETLVRDQGITQTVVFRKPLFGPDKWAAYRAAELFVLPSDFENFGQAAAEALCCGLPVIATTGTPWKALRQSGCGWWVNPDPKSLDEALKEAMSMEESVRKAMGAKGSRLIEPFQPALVAQKMVSLYEAMIDDNTLKNDPLLNAPGHF